MITYSQFKAKYPAGSSVASPEGTYKGECVSLVRTYMKEVDGFVSGPLGHAAQIPSNPTFLKAYEKVSSRKVGDLMFWGDDAGTWTSVYGHTAVYNGNDRMYNQNYNGSRVVSFNPIFTPGFIGYYRKKEQDMVTASQASHLYRMYVQQPTSDWGKENMVGKMTWGQAVKHLKESKKYAELITQSKGGTLQAQKHLPTELMANYTSTSVVLKPGKYEVK